MACEVVDERGFDDVPELESSVGASHDHFVHIDRGMHETGNRRLLLGKKERDFVEDFMLLQEEDEEGGGGEGDEDCAHESHAQNRTTMMMMPIT